MTHVHEINLQLPPRVVRALDAFCAGVGMNRSDAVRQFIAWYILDEDWRQAGGDGEAHNA